MAASSTTPKLVRKWFRRAGRDKKAEADVASDEVACSPGLPPGVSPDSVCVELDAANHGSVGDASVDADAGVVAAEAGMPPGDTAIYQSAETGSSIDTRSENRLGDRLGLGGLGVNGLKRATSHSSVAEDSSLEDDSPGVIYTSPCFGISLKETRGGGKGGGKRGEKNGTDGTDGSPQTGPYFDVATKNELLMSDFNKLCQTIYERNREHWFRWTARVLCHLFESIGARVLLLDERSRRRLTQAIDEMVWNAVQKAVNSDPVCPIIVSTNRPGCGRYAFDNPDNIFKFMPLNNKHVYRIKGFRHPSGNSPTDVTFSLITDATAQNTEQILSLQQVVPDDETAATYTVWIEPQSHPSQFAHASSQPSHCAPSSRSILTSNLQTSLQTGLQTSLQNSLQTSLQSGLQTGPTNLHSALYPNRLSNRPSSRSRPWTERGRTYSQNNLLATTNKSVHLIIRNAVANWGIEMPDEYEVDVFPIDNLERLEDGSRKDAPSTVVGGRDRLKKQVHEFRAYLKQSIFCYMIGALGMQCYSTRRNVLRQPSFLRIGTLASQNTSFGFLVTSPIDAVIVRIRLGHARYFILPLTDPWMISLLDESIQVKNPATGKLTRVMRQTSLNNYQAYPDEADPDCYTFVVSSRDPGIYNWLDTAGYRVVTLMPRWQALDNTPHLDTNPKLNPAICQCTKVPFQQLSSILPIWIKKVSPPQRAAALIERQKGFLDSKLSACAAWPHRRNGQPKPYRLLNIANTLQTTKN